MGGKGIIEGWSDIEMEWGGKKGEKGRMEV